MQNLHNLVKLKIKTIILAFACYICILFNIHQNIIKHAILLFFQDFNACNMFLKNTKIV
jgi:hypothetical protein